MLSFRRVGLPLGLLCLGTCLVFSGCRSLDALGQLKIPSVGFRGLRIEGVQVDPAAQHIAVDMQLRFAYTNPYKASLPVPTHEFGLRINRQGVGPRVREKPAFRLSPQSDTVVTYDFRLDLQERSFQRLNVLGKDNRFEFWADVTLDLADFNLNLPGNMGRKTFHLALADTVRLPLLPVVQPTEQAAQIRFLGQLETFDLGQFKDAIVPFVDLLLTTSFEQDMMAPFIARMNELQCPSPTGQRPCIDMLSGAVIGFLNTAFAADPPLRASLVTQWTQLRNDLLNAPEEGDPIIEEVVGGLLPQASDELLLLKAQWDAFKASPAVIQYPGPRVTGLSVRVPFSIYNPNEFPIEAPALFATTRMNQGYHPISFQAAPTTDAGAIPVIPPQSSMAMTLQMELDWGSGLAELLGGGSQLNPRLQGNTLVDVGYGPMNMRMDIPLNLQMGQ